MTDPIVRLETVQLSVEPGGQGRTLVTVRNLGTIVEGFRLQILGEGVSEWAEVTPPEVQVYPEQEATAVVVFSPPAGNLIRSGTFPFAIRAESVVDTDTSAVAEGDLEIGRVFGLQSKITPVTSSGRWRGKHFLEITNWGNAPIQLKLVATDPDRRLAFLIGPETLDLPLGVTGHAQLRVRTLKPFLRGAQVRLPFQVVAEPDPDDAPTGPPSLIPNPQRATLDGAFVQRAIVSKLTVAIATVLTLAVAGLIAYAVTRGSAANQDSRSQGPPETPTLSAASSDPTSVQLLWGPQPNITSYIINQLRANTDDVADVKTANGGQNVFVVGNLNPSTEYCFKIAAVRGEQTSQLSDKACATTAVAAQVTASPSAAASAGAESASASPTESAASATDSAPPSGTAGGDQQSGGANGIVPPPAGGSGAGPSGSAASTAPSSGPASTVASTPATGPAPVFGPNQYIDVIATNPAADAQALERAQGRVQDLAAAGIAAKILRTTDFPQLKIAGNTPKDSYLVYVGPFGSAQEAGARCAAAPPVGALCEPVRPSPGT
jgi:hypothetical protein